MERERGPLCSANRTAQPDSVARRGQSHLPAFEAGVVEAMGVEEFRIVPGLTAPDAVAAVCAYPGRTASGARGPYQLHVSTVPAHSPQVAGLPARCRLGLPRRRGGSPPSIARELRARSATGCGGTRPARPAAGGSLTEHPGGCQSDTSESWVMTEIWTSTGEGRLPRSGPRSPSFSVVERLDYFSGNAAPIVDRHAFTAGPFPNRLVLFAVHRRPTWCRCGRA